MGSQSQIRARGVRSGPPHTKKGNVSFPIRERKREEEELTRTKDGRIAKAMPIVRRPCETRDAAGCTTCDRNVETSSVVFKSELLPCYNMRRQCICPPLGHCAVLYRTPKKVRWIQDQNVPLHIIKRSR